MLPRLAIVTRAMDTNIDLSRGLSLLVDEVVVGSAVVATPLLSPFTTSSLWAASSPHEDSIDDGSYICDSRAVAHAMHSAFGLAVIAPPLYPQDARQLKTFDTIFDKHVSHVVVRPSSDRHAVTSRLVGTTNESPNKLHAESLSVELMRETISESMH